VILIVIFAWSSKKVVELEVWKSLSGNGSSEAEGWKRARGGGALADGSAGTVAWGWRLATGHRPRTETTAARARRAAEIGAPLLFVGRTENLIASRAALLCLLAGAHRPIHPEKHSAAAVS